MNNLSESNVSITSNLFEQPLSSLGNNDDEDFYSIADDQNPPPLFEISEEELLQKQKK